MQLPENGAGGEEPKSGEILNLKFSPINHNNEHYALHYFRLDASESTKSNNRVANDWLTKDNAVDPRAPLQNNDAFDFFEGLANPDESYIDSEASPVRHQPDIITGTLKQQLDRRSGHLNNGSLDGRDVHYYITGKNNVKLTSQGDAHLARKTALFELPTSAPVSLGVLQNVVLNGRRPYSIGNSWGRNADINGNNVNLLFDKAYLSALTSSSLAAIDPENPLPNVNLIPTWAAKEQAPAPGSDELLSYFLSKGAFNVNSTSKDAWRAILAGVWIPDWKYIEETESGGDTEWNRAEQTRALRRAFGRFAHTGNEVFTAPDNEDNKTDIRGKYYRRGVRRLSSAQIDTMATIIVKMMKQRGKPFASMAEFLSAPAPGENANGKSILEYALAPTQENDLALYDNAPIFHWSLPEMNDGMLSGSQEGEIDIGAPADLSQADLLNQLAPVLQARSDTFKIRAYGDVVGADGRTEASAICELTVQRMPDPVENADRPAARLSPSDKGRQFKVLSLKWLQKP